MLVAETLAHHGHRAFGERRSFVGPVEGEQELGLEDQRKGDLEVLAEERLVDRQRPLRQRQGLPVAPGFGMVG